MPDRANTGGRHRAGGRHRRPPQPLAERSALVTVISMAVTMIGVGVGLAIVQLATI